MQLSENLLLKDSRTEVENDFLKSLEETSVIFHFSERNLLLTESIKARNYYLDCILKNLRKLTECDIEIGMVDFYVQTFLENPIVLSDQRFNYTLLKKIITKIQVYLVYLYYEKEITDFFAPNPTYFFFSWKEEDILNFLEEFNNSMHLNYATLYHDLFKYDNLLFSRGAEENIISYLFQSFRKKKINKRSAEILVNSLKWINQNMLLNEEAFQVSRQLLLENHDPQLLYSYFCKLMNRVLIKDKPEEPNFPVQLTCQDQVIQHIVQKDILSLLINHISESNSYEFAYELYTKIEKVYKSIIQSTPCKQYFIKILIQLIEYASINDKFILNDIKDLINPKDENSNNKEDDEYDDDDESIEMYSQLAFSIIQKIIQKETDQHILTNKLYGYFLLYMRSIKNKFIDIIQEIDLCQNSLILNCSLLAIQRGIGFVPIQLFYPLLASFINRIAKSPEILTDSTLLLCITIYVKCLNYSSQENYKSLSLIFDFLYEKVMNLENFPQQIPIIEEFSQIFNVSNFVSLVCSFGKPQHFIDIIIQMINKMQTNYTQCANELIKSFLKSKYKKDFSQIYDIIFNELDKYAVCNDNVLNIIDILAFFPKENLIKHPLAMVILDKIFNCDNNILFRSNNYIKILTELYGIESYDRIFEFVSEFPCFNSISYISQISTDMILQRNDQSIIQKTLLFGDLILRFLSNYLNVNISDTKKYNDFVTLINESISYFVPILFAIGQYQIHNFISLVTKAINQFDLNPVSIKKFLSFFENPLNGELDEIRWIILDNTKAVFLEGNFDPNIEDFVPVAKELARFQYFMFSLDCHRALAIFDQIKQKSDEYRQFITLMTSPIKSNLDEKINKIISTIKKNSYYRMLKQYP